MEFPIAAQMQVVVFALVLARISGLFVLTPFFSGPSIPVQIKVIIAGGVTLCVAPLLSDQGYTAWLAVQNPIIATLTLLSEFALGLLCGALFSFTIGAIQTAGQLIAHDIGMTMANIIDPVSNRRISIIGQLQATVAIVVFLVLDFHHALLRLLVSTFELVPVGKVTETFAALIGQKLEMLARAEGGILFQSATQLAMPVTVTLIAVTVAMAFLSRAVPEINIFILGFGVRIIVGFCVLVLLFPVLERVYVLMFERALENTWSFVHALLKA